MFAFAATLTFFVFVLAVAFIAVLVAARVLEARQVPAPAGTLGSGDGSMLLKPDEVSSISPFARLLERFDFAELLQKRAEEADLDWSAGRIVSMMLLFGTVTLAIQNELRWLPFMPMLGISAVAAFAPYLYVLRKRTKRFDQFEEMFPEALDSLCRALRAGHPFSAGMELLAAEAAEPVGGEIRKTLDEWKLGMAWNQALDNLATRMPLTDVSVFVAAVKLHAKTGGRLGEVLGKLAETMREAHALQGEVKALAAHGRMTGSVLTVLPLIIALIMFYVSPMQMAILLQHPMGRTLIGVALVCLVLAHFVIRKIVDIKL